MTLVREMPVNAAARIMEITDKRLWRGVEQKTVLDFFFIVYKNSLL